MRDFVVAGQKMHRFSLQIESRHWTIWDLIGRGGEDKEKSFQERLEALTSFKDEHGHVNVTGKQDKSLSDFCKNMRFRRRGTRKGSVLTADRIKGLDDLGFDWEVGGKRKSLEETFRGTEIIQG